MCTTHDEHWQGVRPLCMRTYIGQSTNTNQKPVTSKIRELAVTLSHGKRPRRELPTRTIARKSESTAHGNGHQHATAQHRKLIGSPHHNDSQASSHYIYIFVGSKTRGGRKKMFVSLSTSLIFPTIYEKKWRGRIHHSRTISFPSHVFDTIFFSLRRHVLAHNLIA